jgi:hypothetical protein
MLLTEMLPVLAQELQQLLQAQGRLELAAQIPGLAIVERCRCGDDFCASFYTQPSRALEETRLNGPCTDVC